MSNRDLEIMAYGRLQAETVTIRKQLEDIEQALLDLTPSGSEFHGSPQRCLDWIKARISSTGKLAAQRNRYRKAGEELAKAVDNSRRLDILTLFVDENEEQHQAKRDIIDALRQWNEVRESYEILN